MEQALHFKDVRQALQEMMDFAPPDGYEPQSLD